MKQMSRDPSARSKALRAERRADEKSGLGLITIKPLNSGASATNALEGGTPGSGSGTSTTTGGPGKGKGFKKGGFRNAFGGEPEPVAMGGTAAKDGGTKATLSEEGQGEIEAREEKVGGGAKTEMDMEMRTGMGTGVGYDDDVVDDDDDESESDEGDYAAEGGRYDPRRPTGCGEGCRGLEVKGSGGEF